MFNPLCLLLMATFCWQHVASRPHVQQSFYPPYSDYSYTYSGPGPFHQPFQQQHSPFFSPPGTYFDQRQGVLRPFPGGGVPVLVNYHKRCSDNFVGLKSHPKHQQYYYVCKPDCVIFGKCQNLQIFNSTSGQCVQHPPPEYIPTCNTVGRFPLFSDCHLYYKCGEDLQPKIFACPASKIFSPVSKKCINGKKCTPTQISPHSSYIPEVCASKFPPCFENGIFRSPSDCSLYYKCDLKKNNVYMQTRLQCPQGNFYDLQKNKCLPANEVPCDCIQVAELVYPKPNTLHFQPAMYPAQFELDSLVESQYPVEQTKESVVDQQILSTTTECPTAFNTNFMEQNDSSSGSLANSIKSEEDLMSMLNETDSGSEEIDSAERFRFEADSEEITSHQAAKEIVVPLSDVTAANEEVNKRETAPMETSRELTSEPISLTEKAPLSTIHKEIITTNFEAVATTTAFTITKKEEEPIPSRAWDQSIQPEICENNNNNLDTQTKNSFQTQNKNCLTEHKTTSFNTNSETTKMTPGQEILPVFSSTLQEQNPAIETITIPTQLPTIKPTSNTNSLVTTQIPNETTSVPEKVHLETNILDSTLNLETEGFTHSSEKTTTEIDQATQSSERINDNTQTTISEAIFENVTPSDQRNTIDPNNDADYNDIFGSEITVTPIPEMLEPVPFKSFEEQEIAQKANEENNQTEIPIEDPARTTLSKRQSQDVEQIIESLVTTIKSFQATTVASSSMAPNDEQLIFNGTTESSTDVPTEGDEIKIDGFETATQIEEKLSEGVLLNEELLPLTVKPKDTFKEPQQENTIDNDSPVTLRQVDLSDEDLIPVHSISTDINQLNEETTEFDSDDTTIMANENMSTTPSPIIANTITPQQDKIQETLPFEEELTALKRRHTTLEDTTHTTSSQITTFPVDLINTTEQPNNHKDKNTSNEESDELGISDSEIVIQGQSEEVSNNEINTAETIETTTNSRQQQFPRSTSPIFTPSTQTPTTTPNFKTTSEPSEKQTNNFIIHIRKEVHDQPSHNSTSRKSLYYILKPIPVINNNETVTAAPVSENNNENIPRLEVIAERPIDILLSICPSACDKLHKHNNKSTTSKNAVFLKWFSKKSNETLGFETANNINTDDD